MLNQRANVLHSPRGGTRSELHALWVLAGLDPGPPSALADREYGKNLRQADESDFGEIVNFTLSSSKLVRVKRRFNDCGSPHKGEGKPRLMGTLMVRGSAPSQQIP